jgi:hypothetical protein
MHAGRLPRASVLRFELAMGLMNIKRWPSPRAWVKGFKGSEIVRLFSLAKTGGVSLADDGAVFPMVLGLIQEQRNDVLMEVVFRCEDRAERQV